MNKLLYNSLLTPPYKDWGFIAILDPYRGIYGVGYILFVYNGTSVS